MPTTVTEPTAFEALAQARKELNEAREAFVRADGHRQAECARLAIDAAATVLADPTATHREVVAAHSFLREALALDGRPNTCGVEYIDTVVEACTLPPEDQKWLQDYLSATPAGVHAGSKRCMPRVAAFRAGKAAAALHVRKAQPEESKGDR
jgi:hypothetical protein